MSDLVVVIDVDKTVFSTEQFMDDLVPALEMRFGIDPQQFRGQIPNFYVNGVGNLQYYDFFSHVQQCGLGVDEVERHILETFVGRDYVYDDVPLFLDFLTSEVRPETLLLLTYGERRFQQLKYTCAPTLDALACIDTLRPKGEYITEHFAGRRGVIIDDKLVDDLPTGFKQVWLTRNQASSDERKSYDSLGAVQEHWSEIIAK